MKIYCKNIHCVNASILDEAEIILPNRGYCPLGDDDVTYPCVCKLNFPGFKELEVMNGTVIKYNHTVCTFGSQSECTKRCLWNNSGQCDKDVIAVHPSDSSSNPHWICFNQSDFQFKGHRDWSSLLNPDKTAKGGNLTDSEANRMYQDSLKFKIGLGKNGFTKQAKEPKRKRGQKA